MAYISSFFSLLLDLKTQPLCYKLIYRCCVAYTPSQLRIKNLWTYFFAFVTGKPPSPPSRVNPGWQIGGHLFACHTGPRREINIREEQIIYRQKKGLKIYLVADMRFKIQSIAFVIVLYYTIAQKETFLTEIQKDTNLLEQGTMNGFF